MIDGKNILVIGKRGFGKSIYVDNFILKNKKFFKEFHIFDKVGEHEFLADKIANISLYSCENFISNLDNIYNNAVEDFPSNKPICIVIDEFDTFQKKKDKDIIYKICHFGRKYSIFLIGVVRRPVCLEKSLVVLADDLIVFRITDYKDLTNMTLQSNFEDIKRLKKFEYFLIDL